MHSYSARTYVIVATWSWVRMPWGVVVFLTIFQRNIYVWWLIYYCCTEAASAASLMVTEQNEGASGTIRILRIRPSILNDINPPPLAVVVILMPLLCNREKRERSMNNSLCYIMGKHCELCCKYTLPTVCGGRDPCVAWCLIRQHLLIELLWGIVPVPVM